jgi:hypothetical protein
MNVCSSLISRHKEEEEEEEEEEEGEGICLQWLQA